jgi:cyclopropane fatty-acyl-phospholipid synthase-like methyltransferase
MSDHSTDVMAPPGIAAFFQGWQLYQSIIQNNCMDHREIGTALRCVFEALSNGFTVLDLGCGDSSMAIKALEGLRVTSYTGVDLTSPALDVARANFHGTYSATWMHANMVDYIATADQQFDVIMTSFAMHHLPADIKKAWLVDIAKHLTPRGQLVLVDTCCPLGKSRDETVQTYLDIIEDWPVSTDDKATIAKHMWSSDFPESEAFIDDALTAAGLRHTTIYHHQHGLQIGYLCSRSPIA